MADSKYANKSRDFITVRRMLERPPARERDLARRLMKNSDDAFMKQPNQKKVSETDLVALIHRLHIDREHPARQALDQQFLANMKYYRGLANKHSVEATKLLKEIEQTSDIGALADLQNKRDRQLRRQKLFAMLALQEQNNLRHGSDDRAVYEKAARQFLNFEAEEKDAGVDDGDLTDDDDSDNPQLKEVEVETLKCREALQFYQDAGKLAAQSAWMVHNKMVETAVAVHRIWGDETPFFVPPKDGVTKSQQRMLIATFSKLIELIRYPYEPHNIWDPTTSSDREVIPHDEVEKAPSLFWHLCHLYQLGQRDIELHMTKPPSELHAPFTARRITTVRIELSRYFAFMPWYETGGVWIVDAVLDYSVRSQLDFDHTDHWTSPTAENVEATFASNLEKEQADQKQFDRENRRGDIDLKKAPTRDLEQYVFDTLSRDKDEVTDELLQFANQHLPGQGITKGDIESKTRGANAAAFQRKLNANRRNAQLLEIQLHDESKRLVQRGFQPAVYAAAAAAAAVADMKMHPSHLRVASAQLLAARDKLTKHELAVLGTYIPEYVLKLILPLANYRKAITPGYYAHNLGLRLSFHTDDDVSEEKAARADLVRDAIEAAREDDLAGEVSKQKTVRSQKWSDTRQDSVMAKAVREQDRRRFGTTVTLNGSAAANGGYSALG